MRDESDRLPAVLFTFLSAIVLVTCGLMSQAPQPTYPGVDSAAVYGGAACLSYFGTPYDC
jgi:hypothetical protein